MLHFQSQIAICRTQSILFVSRCYIEQFSLCVNCLLLEILHKCGYLSFGVSFVLWKINYDQMHGLFLSRALLSRKTVKLDFLGPMKIAKYNVFFHSWFTFWQIRELSIFLKPSQKYRMNSSHQQQIPFTPMWKKTVVYVFYYHQNET